MSQSNESEEEETLRDGLYAAAPGREDEVDRLLAASVRGSDAIEGIRFPVTCCPLASQLANSSDNSHEDQ